MAGESQQVPRGEPDPSVMTTEQLDRAISSLRDFMSAELRVLTQRLNGMDKANEVLEETVNRTPTDIQKEIGHVREVSAERFESIGLQFKERDTRSDRESRDNKVAVDAAFAAQKEAAAKQDESNAKAIDKSEKATAETLNKLQDLFTTRTDALAAQIADNKSRMDRAEAALVGGLNQRAEIRNQGIDSRALVASVIGVVVFVLTVAGFIIALTGNK